MSKPRVCIDCGSKKGHINVTQSLQCNKCQAKLFDRLRGIAGKAPMDVEINKIKTLLQKGLKGYEIAIELDLASSYVYGKINEIKGA